MPYTPEQLQQILDLVNSGGGVPAAPEAQAQPQEEYPYDVYQRQFEETQKRRSAGKRYIAQQMLANPRQQEAIEKALRGILDTDVPEMKPFEEDARAKYIMSELTKFRQKDDMIRNIRSELEAASKLTDNKEKAARIRTIVPKLVQSTGTGGADALQPAEVVLGAPEMQSYLGWAKSVGIDPTSATGLATFLTDSAIKSAQFLEADPDKYIQKIKGIYNTFAKTRDEKINDFALMSSPDWVRKNTGLKPLKQFSDIDVADAAQAPLSPAIRAAIEGNAPSSPRAMPQAAPVQGQSGQAPRQRIKFVYDSSGKLVPQQ